MKREKSLLIALGLLCSLIVACSSGGGRHPSLSPQKSVAEHKRKEKLAARDFPLFPWQPPKTSAQSVIPTKLIVNRNCSTQLRDVGDKLEEALIKAGYFDLSWYAVPNGFAIVTGLEQTDSNGTPLQSSTERWEQDFNAPAVFSVGDYVQALFTARAGHYRVMVFAVTDSIPSATVAPDPSAAREWLSRGGSELPKGVGKLEFTAAYHCIALIYEFECRSNKDPAFISASAINGLTHLERSGLLSALRGEE